LNDEILSFFGHILDDKHPPPYVDSNTPGGYAQNQTTFQPPPIIAHTQFSTG
jgi:hypothetical protein